MTITITITSKTAARRRVSGKFPAKGEQLSSFDTYLPQNPPAIKHPKSTTSMPCGSRPSMWLVPFSRAIRSGKLSTFRRALVEQGCTRSQCIRLCAAVSVECWRTSRKTSTKILWMSSRLFPSTVAAPDPCCWELPSPAPPPVPPPPVPPPALPPAFPRFLKISCLILRDCGLNILSIVFEITGTYHKFQCAGSIFFATLYSLQQCTKRTALSGDLLEGFRKGAFSALLAIPLLLR